MFDLLGLRDFIVDGAVVESLSRLQIPVVSCAEAKCECEAGAGTKRDGVEKVIAVTDTPMRGKPVELLIRRSRYRCTKCKRRIVPRGSDLHPTRGMTVRLIRYVENAVIKRPISLVAQEVGLSEKQVTSLADDFIERLTHHRFPQPDILAMDGIKCNSQRFQVLTDGRTGRPLNIIQTWEAKSAGKAIAAVLDPLKIKIFVSDLHKTNLSVARELKAALHVADKFHVVNVCNKALSKIVNSEVDILRKSQRTDCAAELKSMKRDILGKKPKPSAPQQSEFDFDNPKRLNDFPISKIAHSAKLQLLRVYKCDNRANASMALKQFYILAADPRISVPFQDAVSYIKNGEKLVLNYFDALEMNRRGNISGPDTTAAERRNSNIKMIWRNSRGFRDLPRFRLRVIYHPFIFGTHIIECGACNAFEGPFPADEILHRSSQPAQYPKDIRCSKCMTTAP